MSEQEVHEIQLNGKQLVFMFGAAVAVSVVIFLCGVMVGRGVRQPHAELLAATADVPIESQLPFDAPSARVAVPEPMPAPDHEDVTYGTRLEAAGPIDEPLKPRQAPTPPVAPAIAKKPAAPPPEPASSKTFAEPPGDGYVVQVGAYPTRADAEAQAGRLGAKGYRTFITLNNDVPRGRYRVRVGKYPDRRDAEAVALRLRQEERLNPWVP